MALGAPLTHLSPRITIGATVIRTNLHFLKQDAGNYPLHYFALPKSFKKNDESMLGLTDKKTRDEENLKRRWRWQCGVRGQGGGKANLGNKKSKSLSLIGLQFLNISSFMNTLKGNERDGGMTPETQHTQTLAGV